MSDPPQNQVFRLASRPNGEIAPSEFELVDAPMSGPVDSRKRQLTHRPEHHGDYRPHGAKRYCCCDSTACLFLLRFAQRRFRGLVFHAPPRTTARASTGSRPAQIRWNKTPASICSNRASQSAGA